MRTLSGYTPQAIVKIPFIIGSNQYLLVVYGDSHELLIGRCSGGEHVSLCFCTAEREGVNIKDFSARFWYLDRICITCNKVRI